MNEKHLSPLPQYHIDRDKLCEIVKVNIVLPPELILN